MHHHSSLQTNRSNSTSNPFEDISHENFNTSHISSVKQGQISVALSLLQGQDLIVLAGTGQGKSLPFILPGLVTKKPALVFCPLNALEEDMVSLVN